MSAMNGLGWAGLDRLLTAAGAVENNAQLPLDCYMQYICISG